jgi:hypothetical protein
MRWFVQDREGARLPWKEWDNAARDPEDMLASIALGNRAYRACMRAAKLPPQREAANTITAFAHILHHMLDEIDEDRMLELRFVLQEDWREESAGLWEPPSEAIWPIGGDPRLELLSLRHGLERTVGPELLRLFWAGMTASGRIVPLRSEETGTGVLFPLLMLDKMRAENLPAFLDEEERAGLAFLRSELTLSEWTSVDDLEAALSRQRQFVRQGRLYMDGGIGGGRWFDMKEISTWREKVLRVSSLLIAFRVMFLASVTGESGPLRASFPD